MYQKFEGVVLDTIRYSDRHNIVHVFTRSSGLQAFLSPQGKSKEARMRNALLMPCSVVAFEGRFSTGSTIGTMRDVVRLLPLMSIYTHPVKVALAMFLCELVRHSIQEQECNTALYEFLIEAVTALETAEQGLANFHLCVLFRLGALVGIAPEMETYHEGAWFDMREGVFCTARQAPYILEAERARVLWLLSRMSFKNLAAFRFNRLQRNQITETVLEYYRLHIDAIGRLRSPEILRQLFE